MSERPEISADLRRFHHNTANKHWLQSCCIKSTVFPLLTLMCWLLLVMCLHKDLQFTVVSYLLTLSVVE